MAKPIEDRRSGKDRRRLAVAPSTARERRQADRRQFPPSDGPGGLSAQGRELLQAIDAYKKDRGLIRISIDDLLSVMSTLGYRRA